MMLKKALFLFLVCSMIFVPSAFAGDMVEANYVENLFDIKVNGKYITCESYFNDQTGEVYLQLRPIFETMGYKVLWNGKTNEITLTFGNKKSTAYDKKENEEKTGAYKKLYVYNDCVTIICDGENFPANTFIVDGKTFISFEAFWNLNCHEYGDGALNLINIYSSDYKNLSGNQAVFYGENKFLKYEQVSDLIKYLYGDFESAINSGFQNLHSYLVSKLAVESVGKELGISVTTKDIADFIKKNDVEELMKRLDIKDKVFFKNFVISDYALRNKILYSDKEKLFDIKEEDVKKLYEASAESNGLWLKAQHILIQKDGTEKPFEEVNRILKEVKKPRADFSKLMEKYSQDPGSKTYPEGYIFTNGQMVDSFYEGSLNLKVGEISDIVESEFGYHIIKKIAQWENGVPYSEMRDTLASQIGETILSQKTNDYAKEMNVFYSIEKLEKKFGNTK